jgi:hypothetical protein
VENLAPFLHACSACPGDYEDPDLTAWEPDPADSDPDDQNDSSIAARIDWWVDEAGEA